MLKKYIKRLVMLFFVSAFSILLALSCNYSTQQAKSTIKLKVKKLNMYVNDTYRFKLKKCTYKSSNKKIAKVNKKGKVKAKKSGNVKITIKKKNGRAKAVCRIKVGEHATGIKVVGAATILLKSGQTGTVNAIVSPKNVLYNSVEYTVADINIVSVSESGIITPKKSGVTTISVTTKATDKNGRKLSAKVTVVVQEDSAAVQDDKVVGDLGDNLRDYNNIVIIKTPMPTDEPTGVPTSGPTDEPTGVPTGEPTDKPTDKPTNVPTDLPVSTPTSVPTEAPTIVPTATPKPAQTIEEYVQSIIPNPNNPLAASFVVSNSNGEYRTVYLLNKDYSGYMSVNIDGYSYAANKSVMEVLTKLQNETGSVTNSAGTINVMRKSKKSSWKLTFLQTGVVYYFSGSINDNVYNSRFGLMIAEGNTLDNIVINGQ